MERRLFTELRSFYESFMSRPEKNHSLSEYKIRMRDLIDPDVLNRAVHTTMRRYPYFCVELHKNDGQY